MSSERRIFITDALTNAKFAETIERAKRTREAH